MNFHNQMEEYEILKKAFDFRKNHFGEHLYIKYKYKHEGEVFFGEVINIVEIGNIQQFELIVLKDQPPFDPKDNTHPILVNFGEIYQSYFEFSYKRDFKMDNDSQKPTQLFDSSKSQSQVLNQQVDEEVVEKEQDEEEVVEKEQDEEEVVEKEQDEEELPATQLNQNIDNDEKDEDGDNDKEEDEEEMKEIRLRFLGSPSNEENQSDQQLISTTCIECNEWSNEDYCVNCTTIKSAVKDLSENKLVFVEFCKKYSFDVVYGQLSNAFFRTKHRVIKFYPKTSQTLQIREATTLWTYRTLIGLDSEISEEVDIHHMTISNEPKFLESTVSEMNSKRSSQRCEKCRSVITKATLCTKCETLNNAIGLVKQGVHVFIQYQLLTEQLFHGQLSLDEENQNLKIQHMHVYESEEHPQNQTAPITYYNVLTNPNGQLIQFDHTQEINNIKISTTPVFFLRHLHQDHEMDN